LSDDADTAPTGQPDVRSLGAETRLECRICWYIYDPRDGDEVAQVEPNTPFSALPESWRCPVCDAEKAMFLRINE
jgi:rubredoxin